MYVYNYLHVHVYIQKDIALDADGGEKVRKCKRGTLHGLIRIKQRRDKKN